MTEWINFASRLPTADDATKDGLVMALELSGATRPVLWDWIPPQPRFSQDIGHYDAAAIWFANDFKAWKRLEGTS